MSDNSIEECMLRNTMAEGREHSETVVLPRERYRALMNAAAALETSANDCRKLRAECEALRLSKQVNPLEEMLQSSVLQVLNGILTSDMFENRINEELEKAVDRFREGKEFEKQIDSAVKDYLENTHIEVDEAVEAAIKEALDVVKISFQGR